MLVTSSYIDSLLLIIKLAISDAVKQTFHTLKDRFEKEGQSFHAKGQFEWVDGILVEALKRGTWLLIDNVNFCRCINVFSFIRRTRILFCCKSFDAM